MAVKVYSMIYHCWYQRFLTKGSVCQVFHGRSSLLSCFHVFLSVRCHNTHSVCKEWEAVFPPWVLSSSVTETSFSKVICVSPTPNSLVKCLCQYWLVSMVLYTVLQCFLAWSQRLSIGSSVHLTYHLQWVCIVRDISLWTQRYHRLIARVFQASLRLSHFSTENWVFSLNNGIGNGCSDPLGEAKSLDHWRHAPRKDCGDPNTSLFF